MERTVQEELIHASYLSSLRDRWKQAGSTVDFVVYVRSESAAEWSGFRGEIANLDEAESNAVVSALNRGSKFYDTENPLTGKTVDEVLDTL
ncbi:MAG: hypothetical protein WD342_04310 [Verrucomicrobiales bacterium]